MAILAPYEGYSNSVMQLNLEYRNIHDDPHLGSLCYRSAGEDNDLVEGRDARTPVPGYSSAVKERGKVTPKRSKGMPGQPPNPEE